MFHEPFDYSGYANIKDFNSKIWANIHSELESYQSFFLEKEHLFRSKEYKWPSESLKHWSRVWEYPYILYNLKKIKEQYGYNFHILDVGSGVTFFPFYLCSKNFKITMTDIDKIAEQDNNKAIEIFNMNRDDINFQLCTDSSLPFDSNTFDVVTSISVIEHISNLENTIIEINRVLKSKGYLILTYDIDLGGTNELKPENFYNFQNILDKYFNLANNQLISHPNDVLTNKRTLYPDFLFSNSFNSKFKKLKNSIKDILKIKYYKPGYLACSAGLYQKKD